MSSVIHFNNPTKLGKLIYFKNLDTIFLAFWERRGGDNLSGRFCPFLPKKWIVYFAVFLFFRGKSLRLWGIPPSPSPFVPPT
jgi:hypothetical protein